MFSLVLHVLLFYHSSCQNLNPPLISDSRRLNQNQTDPFEICKKYQTEYNIVIKRSWGTMPNDLKTVFDSLRCHEILEEAQFEFLPTLDVDTDNSLKCKNFQKEYDIVPGRSWGTMPDPLKNSYRELQCNKALYKPLVVPYIHGACKAINVVIPTMWKSSTPRALAVRSEYFQTQYASLRHAEENYLGMKKINITYFSSMLDEHKELKWACKFVNCQSIPASEIDPKAIIQTESENVTSKEVSYLTWLGSANLQTKYVLGSWVKIFKNSACPYVVFLEDDTAVRPDFFNQLDFQIEHNHPDILSLLTKTSSARAFLFSFVFIRELLVLISENVIKKPYDWLLLDVKVDETIPKIDAAKHLGALSTATDEGNLQGIDGLPDDVIRKYIPHEDIAPKLK